MKVLDSKKVLDFYNNKKNVKETSLFFNRSTTTIRKLLKKEGVCYDKKIIPKDELFEVYKKNKLSLKEIAKKFDCSVPIIRNNLVKYNILSNKKYNYEKPKKGDKFFRWTFIEEVREKNKKPKWKCECECGTIKNLDYVSVKFGESKSCGCYHSDRMKETKWTGHEKISGKYWYSIKEGARSRNINFNLTIEDAWNIYEKQNGLCSISGVKIRFPENKKDVLKWLEKASLDRIDSNVGYEKNNVQWISKPINFMKGKLSDGELIKICELIYKNNINEKN